MRWSYSSQVKLQQLDHDLRVIVEKVRDVRDISIVTGHRGAEEQELMLALGRSKVGWPNSKHNSMPAKAVDVQPYPYVKETLREDLSFIAGLFVAFGRDSGLIIRWGGDWDRDGETDDNKFDDLFHFELHGEISGL